MPHNVLYVAGRALAHKTRGDQGIADLPAGAAQHVLRWTFVFRLGWSVNQLLMVS